MTPYISQRGGPPGWHRSGPQHNRKVGFLMRRLSMPLLAVLAVLTAPTAAHATGNSGPAPTPQKCACCGDLSQRIDQLNLVFDQRITVLEQRVAVLENKLDNTLNWVTEINNRVTTTINRLEALTCQSDRIYEFRLRTSVDGSPIVSVRDVRVAGTVERGSFSRNAEGRFVITADYRGIVAPRLQFRTVMVHARTADGREYDLVQYVRLCSDAEGGDDGDPNNRPAQDRAGDN